MFFFTFPNQTDENNKLTECPVCHNTEFDPNGFYCKICGTARTNRCTNERDCDRVNTPNARYCEFCGWKTTFFETGLLKPWDEVPEDEKSETDPHAVATPGFSAVETDELPF